MARCIHDLVAEWAARTPDAEALVWRDATVTYRELDERARRLAHTLRGLGVGPDVLVGVAIERSIDLVVAQLAVLQAGGAFLPLDTAAPPERLTSLLADSGAGLVLAGPGALDGVSTSARVIRLEPGWEERCGAGSPESTAEERPPALRPTPDSLAYVMFTSGTTGRPKGVAVPHRAVVRLVRGAGFARLDAAETFLLLAPASFDASTLEI